MFTINEDFTAYSSEEIATLIEQGNAELDRLFEGDIGEANRWLKREGRGLYRPFG